MEQRENLFFSNMEISAALEMDSIYQNCSLLKSVALELAGDEWARLIRSDYVLKQQEQFTWMLAHLAGDKCFDYDPDKSIFEFDP